MLLPRQSPFFDAYIDESSQTGHRHLVLGGVVLPTSDATILNQAIRQIRSPELDDNGEMKWTKVSRRKLPAYIRLVDLFFERRFSNGPHFHSLVVDTHQIDNRRFNEGDREIGFSKEIYQLARKFGRLYGGLFHIYLDHRDTNQLPDKVRTILNFGIRKNGDDRDWPYRRMQFRKSHETPLIQVADVFSGAIAYQLNGHHLAEDASPAKIELSRYILAKANVRNVAADTAIRGKFTIWHRRLR